MTRPFKSFLSSLAIHAIALGVWGCIAWTVQPFHQQAVSQWRFEDRDDTPVAIDWSGEIAADTAMIPETGQLPLASVVSSIEPMLEFPTATLAPAAAPLSAASDSIAMAIAAGADSSDEAGYVRGGGEGSSENDATDGQSSDGASFFGTRASGKRFVFVVDSSSSMNGLRWDTATRELMRSINDLFSDTEFFVICFDTQPHPVLSMFPPKNKYLKNDEATIQRVHRWVRSRVTGADTWPATSMAMAIRMQPDAIFLLSDGVIKDHTVALLREINRDPTTHQVLVPIHTVLLLSPYGRMPLETIANENEGTFRQIDLNTVAW